MEHHLLFAVDINPISANKFSNLLINLIPLGTTRLTIAINSPGGNVVSGIAMYNLMLAMPYTIATHNIANVDSIANAVFLAGSDRSACSGATFMYHGVGFNGNAAERLEENILNAKLDTILADHKRISGIISERSQQRLSVREGMRLFKEQRTRDAQWALEKGIIGQIREFTLPVGGNIHLITD